ncbi:MAG: UPF0149 family protein [Gammaproteobacteria bacterium]|nr:UPF0149 family protein [Gammaproteobacteria bacterium]
MLDYRGLSELLQRAGAEAGAAECHGFLCGQICGAEWLDEELWMEFIDAQTRDDFTADECLAELRMLAAEIRDQIGSLEFEFQLFLPDEDSPLAERVNELGNWCHGFLGGINAAGDEDRPALTADGQELLQDFGAICRVSVEGPDDEDEGALVEVVEYVRAGVMMLFEELRFQSGAGHTGEARH